MSKVFQKTANLIVIMMLTAAVCCGVSAEAALKAAPVNPDFVEWLNKQSAGAAASSTAVSTRANGYIPSPVNWSHLDDAVYNPVSSSYSSSSSSSSVRQTTALPVSYDLRSRMPKVEEQPFGNCWTYSCVAATESNLINKGLVSSSDIDLSEWYLTFFAYNDESQFKPAFTNSTGEAYYDAGGNNWRAVALLSRGSGSVLEAQAPSPANEQAVYSPSVVNRSYKLTDALYLGDLGVEEVRLSEQRREMAKRAILEYGAVSVGIYMNLDDPLYYEYFNRSTNAYKTGGVLSVDHAVAIVGWDDNYSKGNFNTGNQPVADGAWIVRNSWGSNWGDGGHFYVSYEESNLCDGVAYVTEAAPQSEKIYQYDPLGLVGFISYDGSSIGTGEGEGGSAGPVYFANVFTAEENESLGSVAFYCFAPEQEYEIKVYTGCEASPVSGALAATKRTTIAAPGYNTVALDSRVNLTKGEKFSVVICTSSDKTKYVIPCEYYHIKYSEKASSNEGESWLSLNGTDFKDILSVDSNNKVPRANVCIKAFTTAASPTPSGDSSGGCDAGVAALALMALIPLALKKKR
ncbi:MAG: lectin like domain-containing protein [Synergistaceae bacterium]|nr:lectin like domain-containing protein [Synergistaceae bacterium]